MFNNILKINFLGFLVSLVFFSQVSFAQLTGTKTIPGDYATIAAAITALNSNGVGTGGVTFNVAADHTESITDSLRLTATGTVSNPIIFQKSGAGANPKITRTDAGFLATTTFAANGDAVLIIQGSDYVTFDGIDLATNDQGIEYGYFLRRASDTDGCKFVTIKNATVDLAKGTSDFVIGIYSSNLVEGSPLNSATGIVLTSTNGRHENVTIIGNTVQDVHAGIVLRGYVHASPYDFYDQNFTVGQNGAGNTIRNYGGGNSSTTYGVYVIYHNDLSVAYNTINNSAGGGSGFGGTGYGIFTSTGINSNADFNNNTITIEGGGTTSTIYAFNNGIGGSGTDNTVNIYNNILLNSTYPTATTGAMYILYQSTSPFNVNIYGNIIRNNTKSGTSGSMYPLYNINTGTNGFANIYNNQIYSNTNNGTGLIYCLYTNEAATSTKMVYDNIIYNNTGGGDVIGINSLTGVLGHIYGNSIYDLTSNSTGTTSPYTSGIQVSTGTNIYVYNNFISDLKAPTSGAVDAVRGIGFTSAATNSTRGAYFNTIFLNASSSGTNFGTTGIYHINSTTATSSTLDMRNNIVVNLSTPNGTGRTVAFRRSAANANLNNYSEISNNNSFYSGTPGASNLIFFDGTNSDQTMTAFQSRVTPRETLSFTENVPFVNSTTAPYNLHVNTAVATQTESGGTTVSSPIAITDDFDGNTRNVSTPDVGADEFAGTGLDILPPSIFYTPLAHTGSLANRILVVNITDASGVPTTAPGWPHLYWKINAGAWSAATPSSIVGDDFTFSFGAGVSAGDVVSYYVVAQDLAGTPNVGAFPSAGAGGFTINPPAASIPPTEPSTYNVTNTPLAGSYTIGATAFRNLTGKNITFEKVVSRVMREVWVENPVTEESETQMETSGSFQLMEVEEITWIPMENGQHYTGDLYVKKNENPHLNFPDGIDGIYTTITAAVADLNVRGVSGATTFLLEDASYLTETLPMTIDINNEFMPTSVNNVTFKPNTGVTSLISGSSATASSIFILNGSGANYITFDGSNSGGTTRNLTVENTSTSTNTAVFWVSSLADGMGSTNITLKNLVIKAGSNTVTSTFGIYGAGTTVSTTGTGGGNNNLTIQNNEIIKSYRAIYVRGTATDRTEGLNISRNVIGSSNADDYITFRGIDLTNATAPLISQNTIFNIIITTTLTIGAIEFGTNVTDALVSRNYIHTIQSTTGGAIGINISSSTGTSGITIVNNFIAGLTSTGTAGSTISNPFGIRITGGPDHKVYFNNINLFGAFGGTGNYISAPLVNTSTLATNMDVRNNIFSNSMTGDGTTTAYAIYAANGFTYGTINNNDYYATGPNAVLGFLGVDVTTLAGWKAATGQDANSMVSNPFFTSNLDLHVNTGLTPTSLESGGAVISGFTTDFDGDVRPGPAGSVNGGATAPDIGADEFDGVPSVQMVYVSSTVSQDNTSLILANTTNNDIIALQVVTTGEDNALILESIDFTTTGTTNLADITNARVWYTGTSPVFATSLQFGSTLAVPTASFSITGSQALSQGTNYFWLTFDLPGSATNGNIVDAQGPGFVLSSTPRVPTVTNPAGSRTIVGALSGSYDVGTEQDFNTITEAINALHIVGVSGAVTFYLTDSDYSSGETFPLIINAVTGASAVNTITFKPASGVNAVISGTATGSIIKLNGADYITIDGSNSGTSSRNLTIQNNSTAASTSVIWVSSLGTSAGAENNTIKNCNIIGGSRTSTSQFGIYVAGTTVSSTGTGAHNNNLTINNNSISKAYYGIYARGVASTGVNIHLAIINNSIGSDIPDNYIGKYGLDITQSDGASISGNTIFNIIGTATNPTGMLIGLGFVNSTISANHIYEMWYTGTGGYVGKGIDINTGNATSNVTIVNNVIHDLKGDGWSSFTTDAGVGIRILGSTGGINIYYNSVNLSGNTDRSATATVSAGLYIPSTASGLDIRDNVFSNSIVNNLNAGAKAYAIYDAGTNGVFTTINYNDYYASGVQGILGFLTSDITTIVDWRTATGQDAFSFASNPLFNSNSNLRPQPGSPLLAAGTPIAGITTDYLGLTRNATTPSVGAYETGADAIGPIITYTPLPNTNSTSNRTISDVSISDLSGINVTGFKPRIYFKKSTDANVFGGNTSGDNGWKWTETAQTISPFSFTINNSIIFGGSVTQNDSIQYFVVAQDLATVPNVSSNPSIGFTGTSVSSITSAPTTPNAYKIVAAALAGDYTVGLNLFNKVNNRNLVMETRTRKVLVQRPVEEQIVEGIDKNSKTSDKTLTKSGNDDVISETAMILSNKTTSVFGYDIDNTPKDPEVITVVRYETVEVEEEYTVLTENGELFVWKPYSERQFDGFTDGVYPTIAAAAADVAERGVSGPVNFILVDASYTETYPVVCSESFGTSSTNLITFKPQTGLAVTISAASPVTAMFHISGGDYYVFDGLNTGGSSLTLTNASTTVPVFLLENGATNNSLKNLTFNAQYTSTTNGVVNILGTTGSTGNANNTIMNNLFNDNAGSRAAVYINSAGDVGAPNGGNTITGNHFKNFTASGVRATTGSGGNWVINNNQFYNDITATTALTPISFIPGLNSGGTNTLSGNSIGGSAPNAGGTPMTTSSSFVGIIVNADSVNASTISNNLIQNIELTGTLSFNGISSITNGVINITGNTIGHDTNPNSIVVAGTSTTHGINVTAGSLSQPNLIENNLIANMRANGTGTGVRIRGIYYQVSIAAPPIIRNNTIHDLATTSTAVGIGAGAQTALGIHSWPGSSGVFAQQEVTGNTVYSISAENTGDVSTIAVGIFVTNFFGQFSGNRIYDIRNLSTGTSITAPPIAVGLYIRASANPQGYFNNMISVGDGQSTNTQFNGVWNTFSGANIGLYFNSINISGIPASGTLNSHGFLRGDNSGIHNNTTVELRNNIFTNLRSGGTGKHYTLANQSTVPNDTGWSAAASDYNLLNSSDPSTVGLWGTTDQSFSQWQTTTGGDANSFSGEPVTFVNVATGDLHLNMGTNATVLESGGIDIPLINFDFDNDVRPGPAGSVNGGAFASDIGADEFDGVPVGSATFQLSVSLSNGWNMVSIPGLHPVDQNVGTWWAYRVAGSQVFKYSGGYTAVPDATPGLGYWMKQDGARVYNTGEEWPAGGIQIVSHDPLTGASGWNMIGGYELSVTAANVTTVPGGLQSGPIYKYSGGYNTATTIDPGYGYWIKLTGAGQIIIPETMAKGEVVEYFPEDWGRIVLTDAAGVSYTLYAVKGEVDLSQYELPPAPMEGMYDFRFTSGRIAEDINSSVKTIDMSGVVYPLTVRVEGMDIRLMDETGKAINVNLKAGEDIVISDATVQKLKVTGELLPTVYALEQNYPNPFNPSTVIEFSLPENVGNVKLSIYNALGEKVAELVNTSMTAGKYSYQWNAQNIATGMYIYELRTDKFVSVKKMLLLK